MTENKAAEVEIGGKRNWRVVLLRLLMLLVFSLLVLAGVGFFALRQIERAVAFHPERSGLNEPTPAGAENVWFANRSGNRLHGWFFQTQTTPARATVIYFHGNGGTIRNVESIGTRFAAQGFNVLLFDYRGYGLSEGYLEDEDGLYADADAAHEYISRERQVSPNAIVLYGHSLGTAAAVDVAARQHCAALIIESGPSSGRDMARVVLSWLPGQLYWLAKNRFDSAGKLSSVSCPVLIAHGEQDQTIPPEQARALFNAAREPKQLVMLPGTTHNVVGSADDKYFETIAEFIRNSVPQN
ncbi:MAG TPA: alpha/beta hydrolase [Pyrinomonadaceae bacterium]|nr:alpha/beta hydrolase [Pyrinomonadaceae bacterium]